MSTSSLTIPSFQGDPIIFNNELYPQVHTRQGNKESLIEIIKISRVCKNETNETEQTTGKKKDCLREIICLSSLLQAT